MQKIVDKLIKLRVETDSVMPKEINWVSKELLQIQNDLEQLILYSVIHWVAMKDKTPPDTVEEYYTLDDEGNIDVLQWTEGSCFMWCSGGHWNRKEDLNYTEITHWAEIKQPCL